jgi:hypothetical protein
MSQAGRKKPDKWRNLQRAAEQEMAAKRTQLAQLQELNVSVSAMSLLWPSSAQGNTT